ncbi:MAG: divalent metal cation transporter, partial [Lentisphaeraceae bacterium]|nr:divalent metal cation transporter [Lentisphaeraceae bacterium]
MSEEKINADEQKLLAAQKKGGFTLIKTYMSLSGPGWLQSAITLGGGSLAGALFLGVVGGTEFLWVQLAAMIMGVVMLSAIAYVTLSSGKSPYKMIRDDVNPVLAWGWLLASLMANMIWVMPQYALSYSALTDNLGVDLGGGMSSKVIISLVIFTFCTAMVMTYGKGGKGQKVFDIGTKLVVGAIVVTFMIVSFKIIFIDKTFSLGTVLAGFIPSMSHFSEPVGAIGEQLSKLDPAVQGFWKSEIMDIQQTVLIAAAAFAVGVNMTFMMPYSIIARGWNKNFRGLAVFDLSTGMLIPFVLATSCVVIASAAAFHGKAQGAIVQKDGIYIVNEAASKKVQSGLNGIIAKREKSLDKPMSQQELVMATFLIKRDTGSFTKALEGVVGPKMANLIFGLGVLAMGLSTITMLMLICGFCVCEFFGFEHGGKQHKMGTLLGTTGLLWFVVWTGGSAPYLAAITGTFGFIFLPIAYISFLLLFNSKKAMGENMPSGASRIKWNVLMGFSTLLISVAAFGPYGAWNKMMPWKGGQ